MTYYREAERTGPMNEHELWGWLGHKLNTFGFATRLENAAATSVPDILFLAGGLCVFVEMKIGYGDKFYMPPFQYSWGVRAGNSIKDHMHWVAVWNDELNGMMMFTFKRVRSMPNETRNGKIIFEWKPVWDIMKTQFVITNIESAELWIDTVMGLEFK